MIVTGEQTEGGTVLDVEMENGETSSSVMSNTHQRVMMIKIFLFLFVLLACCIEDCTAEVNGKVQPGKAALEVLYMGDVPQGLKEAVKRVVVPKKKFCLVEKVKGKDGKITYRDVGKAVEK